MCSSDLDDIVVVLDALGIKACHFVGLSIGGMIGQSLALRHAARMKTVLLCDTQTESPPDAVAFWGPKIEKIRAAVNDKSFVHQQDYRMVNGWYVYGGRRTYDTETFPKEYAKLRAMAAVRDRYVWDIAQGKEVAAKPDDSKTGDERFVVDASHEWARTDFTLTFSHAEAAVIRQRLLAARGRCEKPDKGTIGIVGHVGATQAQQGAHGGHVVGGCRLPHQLSQRRLHREPRLRLPQHRGSAHQGEQGPPWQSRRRAGLVANHPQPAKAALSGRDAPLEFGQQPRLAYARRAVHPRHLHAAAVETVAHRVVQGLQILASPGERHDLPHHRGLIPANVAKIR